MKKLMIIAALFLGSQAVAQQVPSVLDGLDVRFTKDTQEFSVYDEDVDVLLSRIENLEVTAKDETEGDLFIIKEDEHIKVTILFVLGTKSAGVSFK